MTDDKDRHILMVTPDTDKITAAVEAASTDLRGGSGDLITMMQRTQSTLGYLPTEAMEVIAQRLGVSLQQVYGVATFYSQFRLTPVGKHLVRVCHGTACHVAEVGKVIERLHEGLGIDDGQTTEDGLFTLEVVACLGCCSLAPVIMIDQNVHGRLAPGDIDRIIEQYRNSS